METWRQLARETSVRYTLAVSGLLVEVSDASNRDLVIGMQDKVPVQLRSGTHCAGVLVMVTWLLCVDAAYAVSIGGG